MRDLRIRPGGEAKPEIDTPSPDSVAPTPPAVAAVGEESLGPQKTITFQYAPQSGWTAEIEVREGVFTERDFNQLERLLTTSRFRLRRQAQVAYNDLMKKNYEADLARKALLEEKAGVK